MPTTDVVRVALAARSGVYRTLQNILGNEPTKDMLEQLTGDAVESVFLLFDTEQGTYRKRIEALRDCSARILAGGDEALERLEGRFTRLFVGPGGTEGNPWESYYTSTDKTLFREAVIEVRRAYVAQGLIPGAYPAVADDHIAIELDFLARLAERAEQAWEAGDAAAAIQALDASDVFLRDHPMKWVGCFVQELKQAKHGSAFYLEAAEALEAFLPLDLKVLGDIRTAMQS